MTLATSGANVDWAATGDMLSGLGTVGGAIAVLIAAWVGSSTFSRWKRQRLEERKIALAEQVLALAYKAEEAFEQIRFPSYDAVERKRAFANMEANGTINDNTPIEEQSRLLTPQVTVDRLNDHRPLWADLAEVTPVAKAIFGPVVAEQLAALKKQRGKIAGAANGLAALATEYCREQTEEALRRMDERRDRYEGIIWSGEPANDPFEVAIKEAVVTLDGQLGPIIRSAD